MDLNYNPHISTRILREMERLAREEGLALRVIELLGQEGAIARAYIRAHRRDRAEEFMERVDLDRLEAILLAREAAGDEAEVVATPDLPGFLPVG